MRAVDLTEFDPSPMFPTSRIDRGLGLRNPRRLQDARMSEIEQDLPKASARRCAASPDRERHLDLRERRAARHHATAVSPISMDPPSCSFDNRAWSILDPGRPISRSTCCIAPGGYRGDVPADRSRQGQRSSAAGRMIACARRGSTRRRRSRAGAPITTSSAPIRSSSAVERWSCATRSTRCYLDGRFRSAAD